MAESQRPLTLDEAAAYLNVSVRFMRRLVAERRVAYHKLGALLRFRREDLDGFFAKGRVEPPGPVQARATPSKMTRRMHAG
jgi:excisionase family DNA binding protein